MRVSLAKTGLIAVATLGLATLPALAAEVLLGVPGASKAFNTSLRSGSLSVATAAQDDATAQDLLAAAQADYARLLGVLYGEGFYSSTISIRVDGREAAGIPPLAAPTEIQRIEIAIERGPRFTFGRAEVAPLAPATRLPPEFRPGADARGTLIGSAARAGVTGWRDAGHAKAAVAGQDIAGGPPAACATSASAPSRACPRARPFRLLCLTNPPTGCAAPGRSDRSA
jgi:translocation and assembly module TamA